jgi:hypothetical protein
MPLKLIHKKSPGSGILFVWLNRAIHFLRWLGCEVASLMPPTFYPCPESTGTPDATYALTRLATNLRRRPHLQDRDE